MNWNLSHAIELSLKLQGLETLGVSGLLFFLLLSQFTLMKGWDLQSSLKHKVNGKHDYNNGSIFYLNSEMRNCLNRLKFHKCLRMESQTTEKLWGTKFKMQKSTSHRTLAFIIILWQDGFFLICCQLYSYPNYSVKYEHHILQFQVFWNVPCTVHFGFCLVLFLVLFFPQLIPSFWHSHKWRDTPLFSLESLECLCCLILFSFRVT